MHVTGVNVNEMCSEKFQVNYMGVLLSYISVYASSGNEKIHSEQRPPETSRIYSRIQSKYGSLQRRGLNKLKYCTVCTLQDEHSISYWEGVLCVIYGIINNYGKKNQQL